MTLRKWMYVSHIALGFSGAMCFLTILGLALYNAPLLHSLAGHADNASANFVTASGVVANGAAEQAKQAAAIERDVRVTFWHLDRAIMRLNKATDAATALLGEATQTTAQLRSNLSSAQGTTDAATKFVDALRADAEAAKPVLVHADETTRAGTEALNSINDVLKDKSIKAMLDGMATTTSNMGRATGDFADKFHTLLYPPPCKTTGCRVGKRILPVLKYGPEFGSDTYWTLRLFSAFGAP